MSDTSLSPHPLQDIASWVSDVDDNWSQIARDTAHRALIDTLACALAGSSDPVVTKLLSVVKDWGAGPSTIIGHAESLSAPWAGLVNGASAHALDFDDNFDPAKAHASAVLVPALLAVGEQEDANLGAFLDAYLVGLQVMGHVGQAVNPFHRSRGWHATATLGAIGAAAGCARLLGLPADQAAHAISMSTSRAGGFMSQFGTDTKPLHAGFAASGGVQSALLARAGLTAGANTLDGPASLRTLMVGLDVEARADEMASAAEHGQSVSFRPGRITAPIHAEAYGLKIKRFPNCGSVHRALDGLLELRERHGLTADLVTRVHVRAPGAHLRNLMYEDPQTPAEAKFSLEYNLATGLLSGAVGLADFEKPALANPSVRALLPKITKDYVEKLESEFPTEVHVYTINDEHFETSIQMPVGSKEKPLRGEDLMDKFDNCVSTYANWPHGANLKQILRDAKSEMPLSALCAHLRNKRTHQAT